MNNLQSFGWGLLVSVVVLTGFGHMLFFVIIFSSLVVFLLVKKKKTRYRRVYFLGGGVVGVISLLITLYHKNPKVSFTKGDAIQVHLTQKIKDSTYEALIISGPTIQDTPFLVQSNDFDYPLGSVVQIEVQDITAASYPNITVRGLLHRYPISFEYSRRLAMKGYGGHILVGSHALYPKDMQLTYTQTHRTNTLSHTLREMLHARYSIRTAGLIEGMLIGGRTGLSSQEYDDFIQSGLVHIIAVSGSNILMVVIFLSALLFWMPWYPKLLILIVGIICYSVLTGLDSSVFRALVMGMTMLTALLVGRRIAIGRSLRYAGILLTVANPWVVLYDVGFLLSFGALLGILTLSTWYSSSKNTSWVSSYILPSFGATLGVLPILVVVMDGLNLLSPFINIGVVALVPLILLGSIVGALVSFPLLTFCVEKLVSLIFWIASWTSNHAVMLEVNTTVSKIIVIGMLVCLYILIQKGIAYKKRVLLRA